MPRTFQGDAEDQAAGGAETAQHPQSSATWSREPTTTAGSSGAPCHRQPPASAEAELHQERNWLFLL